MSNSPLFDEGSSGADQVVDVGPGGYPIIIWSPEDFATAFVNGWVVDGRSGGLVRGRSHEQGHIVMISPSSPLGRYELVGLMEGGEYLMSTDATAIHQERLKEINGDNTPCDTPLPAAPAGRVLDVTAEPHDKLLVIERQFIINCNSTRRHLDELLALNAPHVHNRGQFFTDAIVRHLGSHPELGYDAPDL